MESAIFGAQNQPSAGALVRRFQHVLQINRYALATEKSYLGWLRQYLRFHGAPHHWTPDWDSRDNDVATTMIYTHVAAVGSRVKSPLDA